MPKARISQPNISGAKLEFFGDLRSTYPAPHVAFFQMHAFFIASLRIGTLENPEFTGIISTNYMSMSLGTP